MDIGWGEAGALRREGWLRESSAHFASLEKAIFWLRISGILGTPLRGECSNAHSWPVKIPSIFCVVTPYLLVPGCDRVGKS